VGASVGCLILIVLGVTLLVLLRKRLRPSQPTSGQAALQGLPPASVSAKSDKKAFSNNIYSLPPLPPYTSRPFPDEAPPVYQSLQSVYSPEGKDDLPPSYSNAGYSTIGSVTESVQDQEKK